MKSKAHVLRTDSKMLDLQKLKALSELVGSKPRPIEKWTRALSFSPFIAFVEQKDDGRLLGFGRIESDGKIYVIYDMCVLPAFQRTGIGTTIVKSLIKQAQDANIKRIGLSAWTPNAKRFYLKSGFSEALTDLDLDNYMEIDTSF